MLNMINKSICRYLVLLFFICLMLTGCNNNEPNSEKYDYNKFAFTGEDILLDEFVGDIIAASFYNENYFLVIKNSDDYMLYYLKGDLTDYKKLDEITDEEVIDVSCGESIVLLLADKTGTISIRKYNYKGDKISEIEILQRNNLNYDYLELKTSDNGTIAVVDSMELHLFDKDLNQLATIKEEGKQVVGIEFDTNGTLVCCVRESLGSDYGYLTYLAYIDDNKIIKYKNSECDLSGIYNYVIPECNTGKIYIRLNDGIYCINEKDGSLEKKMDYFDSFIYSSEAESFVVIGDVEFAQIEYKNDKCRLRKYIHSDSEISDNKIIITYGRFMVSERTSKMIIDYNRNSSKYYIRVKDYSYGEEGRDRFNLDIAKGDCPDIIDLKGSGGAASYISKGIAENLYPYIEKDDEIEFEDFTDSYLDAVENDEKIYFISDSYNVRTLVTSKNVDLTEYNCSADEFKDYINSKPNASIFPWDSSREDLCYLLFMPEFSQYIDYTNEKCNVDNSSFVKMSSLCYDKGIETRSDTIPSFDDMVGKYHNKEALFWTDVTPEEMGFLKYIFGDEICYCGYPEIGTIFSPTEMICMSSSSKNKEGCWDFMRRCLLEENQKNNVLSDGDVIPTRKDCLELLCKRLLIENTYIDENGDEVTPLQSDIYVSGELIKQNPIEENDVNHFIDLINNTHICESSDDKISSIIMEELRTYFKDEHDISVTIELINNRVETYLKETN